MTADQQRGGPASAGLKAPSAEPGRAEWRALWALVIGFFMILVDSTIVAVATDALLVGLDTDLNSVVWVTSAYLLAFVVPLLLSGRLGDQFGPKRVYLVGLALFTVASALCGLAPSVGFLIAARVLQGIGASMMTPQTMAVITRTFPPHRRGTAMSLWGAVAGIAVLVGPIVGGVLVQTLGWEWIFFVNVPVGIIAFVAVLKRVPSLATNAHRFDVLGMVLSTAGLFMLVFGIQEGHKNGWGTIAGPITVPALIAAGVILLVLFLLWQARTSEPLMSLSLFADRNFSLANVGILTMSFAVTGIAIPMMLFAQKSLGLSPLMAALLTAPLALASGFLAVPVGRMADRMHPRILAGGGLLVSAIATAWLGWVMTTSLSIAAVLPPIIVMGVGNAFVWAPLSTTATRKLPMRLAGAGAGVYNTNRQVGAVLGSAAVGVLMQVRLVAETSAGAALNERTGPLPADLAGPFGAAMGQSLYLPAVALLLGFVATLWFEKPPPRPVPAQPAAAASAPPTA